MKVVNSVAELRSCTLPWRTRTGLTAFVPTMGNLHAGHLKLVRHARAIAERVVVSIFVNPLQFGQDEDYGKYPVSRERDISLLADVDTDLLFMPEVSEMYANKPGHTTHVVPPPELCAILEGEYRPGHFEGVTTVVAKLFNMLQPDIALFGEKDFQQLLIIRRMVSDLNMPIVIEAVETVREADGLAMSSRNSYLNTAERAIAPQLYQTLLGVRDRLICAEHDPGGIEQAAMDQLREAGFGPQYVSVRRSADLGIPNGDHGDRVVLAAAMLGGTRLIDNVKVSST